MTSSPHLLVFGPGYSAQALMATAQEAGWKVSATYRRAEVAETLRADGYDALDFDAFHDPAFTLSQPATHIVTSIPPDRSGGKDPVLEHARAWLENRKHIEWIGYLSSTNVYGDHNGGWVDETTPPKPGLVRGQRRLVAEAAWLALAPILGARVHVFRLAGIYGPGKNALRTVLSGSAKRVFKPGQMFGRIHRDDIARALWLAALGRAETGIFNLSDDMSAPSQDVIEEAARLLGKPVPPLIPLEEADLSEMGRSFYEENKLVSNKKAKEILGWQPLYPDYRTALRAMLAEETSAQ